MVSRGLISIGSLLNAIGIIDLYSLALILRVVPRLSEFALFTLLLSATFVPHSLWPAVGRSAFMIQVTDLSKNAAIWSGLLFVAGTGDEPGWHGARHNG